MRFAVVADTHVRPGDLPPGGFAANAFLEGRNRHLVEVLNRLAPAFVIHLGDVVHPVPGDAHHDRANALAAAAYQGLSVPLHVVPGNHDVGDKPFPWVDAPKAVEQHYATFEARWGPRRRTFSMEGCRFVLLDTPVLGTGGDAEADQWRWLEGVLLDASEAGERIFLFGHYPPYLWDPDEEEHYDNLAPAVRARLLDLVERYSVEAIFSGHVHRFFHGRHGDTDLYVVPAIGFVRPGYAEFDAVSPGDQFGRDHRAKLGFFLVDVGGEGHVVHPIRTWGQVEGDDSAAVEAMAAPGWRVHLGVTLRHGWAAPRDLTMDGLDEFSRKRARDDAAVLALWEARIGRVRVPVADVEWPDTRRRILELAARGLRFTVLVPGRARLAGLAATPGAERWEVVLAPGEVGEMRVARPPSGSVAVGPLVPFTGLEWQGGHFVAHGFSPGDDVDSLARRAGDADEIVFRVAPDAAVWESVAQAAELVAGHGFRAVINVQLPRREEGRMFDDDVLVANRVVEAEVAARAFRDTTVFIDGFIDHDRGYYPRVGLLDRRGDPRGGLRALVAFASTLSSGSNWRLVDVDASARYFEGDHQGLLLVEGEIRAPAGRVVSLLDGRPGGAQLQPGPWLVMDSFQP